MSHKLMPATDHRHTSRMLLSCYGLNGVMQQKVNAEQKGQKAAAANVALQECH
jgi:hypothetical protein